MEMRVAILDGKNNRIPIHKSVEEAIEAFKKSPNPATHLVVGLARTGAGSRRSLEKDVLSALEEGLHVDSGLHDFLSEDDQMRSVAEKMAAVIRDVRKPPERKTLIFSAQDRRCIMFERGGFGNDSAIGKRTTAWILADALQSAGHPPS